MYFVPIDYSAQLMTRALGFQSEFENIEVEGLKDNTPKTVTRQNQTSSTEFYFNYLSPIDAMLVFKVGRKVVPAALFGKEFEKYQMKAIKNHNPDIPMDIFNAAKKLWKLGSSKVLKFKDNTNVPELFAAFDDTVDFLGPSTYRGTEEFPSAYCAEVNGTIEEKIISKKIGLTVFMGLLL